MTWPQIYDPLASPALSALVASLPIVVLMLLLGVWHVRAHIAALVALGSALGLAVFVYKMPPVLAGMAALNGTLFGLFPIGWLVLNAIFIYELSVATGQFAVLQRHVSSLAGDRRIQALLIAYCFGAFIEGAAGFGAPVAISGALMIGLGFKPLEAAKLALIGNTAPVAFGSLGIPLTTLNNVTGMDLMELSAMVGKQLPPFSFIVPFWLIAAMVGWRGMLAVWPACFVCGATFGLTQFLVSNFHGPWLVDLASSLVSMFALVVLLKFWRPRDVESAQPERLPFAAVARAWLPWLCLTDFVFLSSLPVVKKALNQLSAPAFVLDPLHNAVLRVPPVVPHAEPERAVFTLNWLSSTGTALLLAGITAGFLLGLRPAALGRIYVRTVRRTALSLFTIALMLALGFTTRFSGSDTTLGLAFAATGWWFPFFSPLLGWLGVALTGSDTASNVLFGNLQKVTAEQLGLNPVMMGAANSAGGVMGKMIDAQSIVVANAATASEHQRVGAGTILRAVFLHSIALAVLMGLWNLLLARLWH